MIGPRDNQKIPDVDIHDPVLGVKACFVHEQGSGSSSNGARSVDPGADQRHRNQ